VTGKGFTVFFTGLSGAGKSTTANALQQRLHELGRTVTSLDGDAIRKHLSRELGFSREHRDLNIRRIGFVAAEVTRHGGACICANIAPYDSTRREVRTMIEAHGGFVLVHVATPMSVCESRDSKGLYAKARAGLLQEFTGVSDPYEVPRDAEITIDTSKMSANEAAETIVRFLQARDYL
jgi:sulfate adenylyltransferase